MHGEEPVQLEATSGVLVAGASRVADPGSVTSQLRPLVDMAITILRRASVPPAGPPIAKQFPIGPGEVELKVGFAVRGDDPAVTALPTFSLPGGDVASTWHLGPRETIPATYQRLERWLLDRGKRPSSTGPWEVLWAGWGGTSVPSSRSRIQVIWPLDAAWP